MPVLPNTKIGLQLGQSLTAPTPLEQSGRTVQNIMDLMQVPEDYPVEPNTDYQKKIEELTRKTQELLTRSAENSAYNNTPNFDVNPVNVRGGGKGGGYSLDSLLRAMGAQESGNSYGARNSSSGAMGRWQVMPSNIQGTGRGWDYEVLGRDISTSQFMNSPSLQNKIVRSKFGDYLSKYGARGALSAWYSGSPTKAYSKTPQGNYPSIYNYIQQVLDRL